MAKFQDLARLKGRVSSLPPAAMRLASSELGIADAGPKIDGLQPISAFVCIIDYGGETRPITCRRYETIGDHAYVGAICHSARGYRQFRCDRIEAVFDASTGEAIGDGSFFLRFAVDASRTRAPTWGLTPSRKATLVAGLNILAFMARCDGQWHPLEAEVIEAFVCSMWLRKEWEGDPPMEEIIAHAERLAPDSDVFFSALRAYAQSQTSTRLIKQAVGDLIAADGVICDVELEWGAELDAFMTGYSEELFAEHFQEWGIVITT